ncbi:50S ribosomal protein L15 [Lactococcus hircilactis]|uniref:Large ribosomal subunit protein uL15 n=1 Tax=Lactococcus hircilactis TaxID=1494462 RepID=A0A7X1ZC48_9LACT|nr:50S ribosomal protein L15 [Lactococcus hircilactis]MQW40380.1 50S ribosomal protein L15 [Lactococcus hircilactis]
MELHTLKAAEGSRHSKNRVGRGTSSGNGKTAGRGQKGQKARSGGSIRPGFEGGQTPLFRRMPKRGFLNVNRKEYAIVNLDVLSKLEDGATVNAESLKAAKIIKDVKDGVKVLANGELTAKNLTVDVAKVSAAAKAAIEAAGGKVVEAAKAE